MCIDIGKILYEIVNEQISFLMYGILAPYN